MGQVREKAASTRANYNRLSRWYDLLSGSAEQRATEVGLRQLAVGSGERVLEIGAGTGKALVALASAVSPLGCALGIDLAEGMLAQAGARLGRSGLAGAAGLVQGDALHLPTGSACCDALFMSFTLELFGLAEIEVLLRECRRVLRPGGRLCVVALAAQEPPTWPVAVYAWAHRRFPTWIDCRPIPVRSLLVAGGFRVVAENTLALFGLPVAVVSAV